MFENPRRGRQARNFTTNVPKILDLKSSSEQVFSENCRSVPLARRFVEHYQKEKYLLQRQQKLRLTTDSRKLCQSKLSLMLICSNTGSPSSKYEHQRASALLRNIQNILGLHVTSPKIKLRNYRFF